MADNEALSRMRYKAKKKKKNPKETGASLLQSGSSILSSASKGKNTASKTTKTRNGKVAGVKQVSRNNSKRKKTTTLFQTVPDCSWWEEVSAYHGK